MVISWYGKKTVTLDLAQEFHRRRIQIKSSQVSFLSPTLSSRWDTERRMALSLEFLPVLKVEESITHTIPFAEAAQAFQLIDQKPEEVVQVILDYSGEGIDV